ncbi:MAG: hypothetical protein COV08_00365 [Candidatus Vogelbacteria bacterium CG10_big_fil_rev_8_21_14_0_10_49_38]|uniref:TIGR00725 family protein n=1 Tax=Candidatus Vogelbacteria bacterium CG10_big_fil_rev_8_21_14_0_10_49_38 TaxID=1975043 RepID=A0A2H0RII1_9BACT|nr:MAG: hypothetical protein BK006_00370 [bacterium CG10_49_38]PIR46372.1 MAG: hypothetical protein COV08_00365 [Candidatus Vogelbacteria bacterium CG10_big_fil_rev_8_21_14_0_10_49_38]
MDNEQLAAMRYEHRKIKICVSGAADTTHCGEGALESAKELGREIVRQGAIIVTGATTGWPLWSAMGAKEAGGVSIGLSPAATEKEHVEKWGLPIDFLDTIIYTGQGFPGRDILLTRTSDAVVLGCGRIGTIHEFTVAFEDKKPIGILEGPWEMDETLKTIIERAKRPNPKIVFDSDPKKLIARVIELAQADKIL